MYIYTYIHTHTHIRIHVHKFTERATRFVVLILGIRYIHRVYPPRILVTDHQQSSSWDKFNFREINARESRPSTFPVNSTNSLFCRRSLDFPLRFERFRSLKDAARDPCCRAGSGAGQSGACADLGATLLGRILERDRGHDPLLGPGQPVAED